MRFDFPHILLPLDKAVYGPVKKYSNTAPDNRFWPPHPASFLTLCRHKKLDQPKSGFFIPSPRAASQSLPKGTLPRTLSLCLKPGVSVSSVAERLGLISRRHAMSFLALTNLPDNLASESSARTAMTEALFRCTSDYLQNLFEDIDFIINSAPFIRKKCGDLAGYQTMMQMVRYAIECFLTGMFTCLSCHRC
ncbi:hypothetical protein ElyMa_005669900 [Elysia marginata]|uniref:Uncharacterized protein n=1 Tax=Elysia marginata TaxID=1093978 RepID=A0AAV4FDY6_9GAST|nr:hypothetical protein ElyMa_005669900 [Elysia marginata]